MPVKNAEGPWEIFELLAYCQANDQIRFFKELTIITEINHNAYDVKRPNLTQRIMSVSIRQESLRCPSIADRWRKYSPEGTRVLPRERYVS